MPDEDISLTRNKILWGAVFASALITVYEVGRCIKYSDMWPWYYWLLEMMTGIVATFALVWVALHFERMDKLLERYSNATTALIREVNTTKQELETTRIEMQTEFGRTIEQTGQQANSMQKSLEEAHSRLSSATGSLIDLAEIEASKEELKEILKGKPEIFKTYTESIKNISNLWAKVITDAHNSQNEHALCCWDLLLDTYLSEEAEGITHKVVTTNVGVYLDILSAFMNEFLKEVISGKGKLNFYAVTNVLPEEWYNWKDRTEELCYGRKSNFFDKYRQNICDVLKTSSPEKLLLKRYILVHEFQNQTFEQEGTEDLKQKILTVRELGIQKLDQLKQQSEKYILCDKQETPKCCSFQELQDILLKDYEQRSIKELANREVDFKAYAISEKFKKTNNFVKIPLLDLFIKTLHSGEAEKEKINNAKVVILEKSNVGLVDSLPSMLTPESGREIKCPDFLYIEIGENPVAAVTAQLKPPHETMLLHLITEVDLLQRIKTFIKLADNISMTLNDAVK